MKIILILLLSLFHVNLNTQTAYQKNILEKFIKAHNDGSEVAIKNFIKESYHPAVYKKIDINKHVNFYNHIIKEFGPLNKLTYKVTEESKRKLIVQLIKENESVLNQDIDPAEILVVEIDMSEDNPKYMERGLGLGALVCEDRR